MEQNKKPKRILKNITFENEDAHIALVHKKQGGAASGANYKLVLKGRDFSEEFLEKASQVKVTIPIEEFLMRFFGMMEDQAEILARAMGYTTTKMDKSSLEAQEESLEMREQEIDPEMPEESDGQEYEDWIQSQMESFEIMKSLSNCENIAETISTLDEDDCIGLLRDQSLIEKAFRKITRAEKALSKKSNFVAKAAAEEDAPQNASVGNKVEVVTSDVENKENTMTIETQVVQQEVEVIAKAEFDQIAKAFAEQKEQLEKALDSIAQFQAEKKEAILKSRKAELDAAVKNAERSEVIFKAIKECSDEDFQAVVKTLAEIQEVVEKSALFEEMGATVQDEAPAVQESAVEKLIKSKYKK